MTRKKTRFALWAGARRSGLAPRNEILLVSKVVDVGPDDGRLILTRLSVDEAKHLHRELDRLMGSIVADEVLDR